LAAQLGSSLPAGRFTSWSRSTRSHQSEFRSSRSAYRSPRSDVSPLSPAPDAPPEPPGEAGRGNAAASCFQLRKNESLFCPTCKEKVKKDRRGHPSSRTVTPQTGGRIPYKRCMVHPAWSGRKIPSRDRRQEDGSHPDGSLLDICRSLLGHQLRRHQVRRRVRTSPLDRGHSLHRRRPPYALRLAHP
jgi:hypothetical protein